MHTVLIQRKLKMAGEKAKGGKKNRKYGNKKPGAIRYMAESRYTRNKTRKLKRHLKLQPHDKQARETLTPSPSETV